MPMLSCTNSFPGSHHHPVNQIHLGHKKGSGSPSRVRSAKKDKRPEQVL